MKFDRALISIAALSGFLAVGLGAFGAHALEAMLVETGRADTWATGVLYHMVHSVAALAVGMFGRLLAAGWVFLFGNLIFGGTLYLLCLTGITWLGAITPIGGLAYLVGWAILGIGVLRIPEG